MLQQKKADDYVIATGNQYSVKKFIQLVAEQLRMKIKWKGRGIKEKCYWNKNVIIQVDKKYFRPTEVDSLRGDFNKARKKLGWKPKIKIKELIKDMINYERQHILQ